VERLGQKLTKNELSGWEIQLRAGAVDHAVDGEAEAFACARRFRSYLPSSIDELPPRGPRGDDPGRREAWLFGAIPHDVRKPYKMRAIVEAVVVACSFFELGALYGRAMVTGFARLDGWPVALMASDPFFYGGAWTADTCEKVERFVDLAQTFHLPVVYLVDCPGFLIGKEAERTGTIKQGVRAMSAIWQTTVPWCAVIVRNVFGVAGAAHRNGSRYCTRYAWPSGRWGSLPLEGGIEAAYRADLDAAARRATVRGHRRPAPLIRGREAAMRTRREFLTTTMTAAGAALTPRWAHAAPKAITVVRESSFIKPFDDYFAKTLALEYEK